MEIDEAINHARHVAGQCKAGSDCAHQHKELADWLEELKKYWKTGLTPEQVKELKQRKNERNGLLTLGELRKMDGKTVYCLELNADVTVIAQEQGFINVRWDKEDDPWFYLANELTLYRERPEETKE